MLCKGYICEETRDGYDDSQPPGQKSGATRGVVLDEAGRRQHQTPRIIRLLIEHGADINNLRTNETTNFDTFTLPAGASAYDIAETHAPEELRPKLTSLIDAAVAGAPWSYE